MITISLDEYGDFEKKNKKPLIIAGVLFDDLDGSYELINERKRIKAYYKSVLANSGDNLVYPVDLHPNGDKERDSTVIAAVKQGFTESISEFLCHGTYKGCEFLDDDGRHIAPRNGKYHVFAYLKSNRGKANLLGQNVNILLKDNYASNLYFHMAEAVVHRIIMNNPFYDDAEKITFNIDLASRSTELIDKMSDEKREEYKKQGFKEKKVGDTENENSLYTVMNEDMYRTLIADELSCGRYKNIVIDKFSTRSIVYQKGARNQEFLYLSDSICSVLGYGLDGSAEACIDDLVKRIEELNKGNGNLVFVYDIIDNYFNRAWEYYKENRIIDALSVLYDSERYKDRYSVYYRNKLFPDIKKRICRIATPELFTECVDQIYHMLNLNNLDQDRLIYLIGHLEEMIKFVEGEYRSADNRARTLYRLYETGMSAYCHIGDSDKALSYYDRCKEYAAYMDVDSYLRTNNKLVVCLEDSFEWDKAEEIAGETVSYQELASDMKRSIYGGDIEYTNEAKAISQYARILALKRDSKAAETFRSALAKMERGSANYKITQSYLLHHLADMGLKEEYEKELAEYMDGTEIYYDSINSVLRASSGQEDIRSKEYALYVLIRGLYYFGSEAEIDKVWKSIRDIEAILKQADGHLPAGHPWEIIYKYLIMIAIRKEDVKSAEKFRNLLDNCLGNEGKTITALKIYGDAEIADQMNDVERRDKITSELAGFLKNNYISMSQRCFSEDGTIRYAEMGDIFAFMYR